MNSKNHKCSGKKNQTTSAKISAFYKVHWNFILQHTAIKTSWIVVVSTNTTPATQKISELILGFHQNQNSASLFRDQAVENGWKTIKWAMKYNQVVTPKEDMNRKSWVPSYIVMGIAFRTEWIYRILPVLSFQSIFMQSASISADTFPAGDA